MKEIQAKWDIAARYNEAKEYANQVLTITPPFPANVLVELTNACNHACIFCSNSKMTRPRKLIDKNLLVTILEQARSMGAQEVGFYATGEPLIHKDLELFIAKAKQLGFTYVYISTNGAAGGTGRIKSVIDAGLDSIKFSINAGTPETYLKVHGKDDWDRVITNLKFADQYREEKNLNLKLAISYVSFPYNQHEKEDMTRQLGHLVDDIHFSDPGNMGGYMLDDKGSMVPTSEAPCWMLFNRVHITCEGYLTLCCIDYQNYVAVADLQKQPLAEAWLSPVLQEMRSRHLKNELKGTLCYNCVNNRYTDIKPLVQEFATEFDFKAGIEEKVSQT
ncbi:MAG: radical SAM protein [Desulfobacterales bacterium]|nr:radical SAM protein [Desulfobacterales bacterium]